MSGRRVLVAGIGNIFLGDDGFGVEVARRLCTAHASELPDWVDVVDYGVRGMHLAYDLAGADRELTIMVDATARGDAPGTVYVVELDTVEPDTAAADVSPVLDAHGMQPDVVLNLVVALGEDPGRVLLVGCEPAVLDERMGLSPAVERAVEPAARAVLELIAEHCASQDASQDASHSASQHASHGAGQDAREEPPCALASPGK